LDASTGRKLRAFPAYAEGVRFLAFAPDGTILASTVSSKTLDFWIVDSGKKLFFLPCESGGVIAFSPRR
jgi:WD40 repeat protein